MIIIKINNPHSKRMWIQTWPIILDFLIIYNTIQTKCSETSGPCMYVQCFKRYWRIPDLPGKYLGNEYIILSSNSVCR